MDDYSKFLKAPSNFIKGYQIKNGEIIVRAKCKKKIKQYKFRVTKSKIKYYESILLNQYQEVISKQNEILRSKIDIRVGVYCVIAMFLCIASAILSDFSDTLGKFLCGSGMLTFLVNVLDNYIYSEYFKSKIKLYKMFLNQRTKLEQSNELRQISIYTLSNRTQKNLRTNIELKEDGLIDNVFNINFMDMASLKDLRNLITIYNDFTSLQENSDDKNRKKYSRVRKK